MGSKSRVKRSAPITFAPVEEWNGGDGGRGQGRSERKITNSEKKADSKLDLPKVAREMGGKRKLWNCIA